MKHSTLISRRAVLRGLGATIVLPCLDILGGRTFAATQGKTDPPRLACFYIPGAIGRNGWFPKDTGRNYTLADSHKPLEKHRDQFSVLSNLRHIEGQISGHVFPYNWLTGHNINQIAGTITNTISMDQVAAQHLGPTWLPSMALSFRDGVGTSTLSRNALGVDIPAIGNHRTLFERLFPPADKAQLEAARARVALNRSVLDTAMGDVKSYRGKLTAMDKDRLDQYLESIREIEKRLIDSDKILQNGRPQFDESGVQTEPAGKNSMREHIELMTDLIALAFQTDMTRVVTHSLGGEGGPNYDEYKTWAKDAGAPMRGAHDYHHKGGQAPDPNNPDAKVITRRDEMFSACLARLMDKLAAIKATDGSLLDHTVLLFGGCQINSHSGKSFPTLLAGGRKLGFRHGQHLKWDGRKPMSDLYLTILTQLGCPVESFKESKGVLSELLA
ncbi:MAG: DUF1552 domain-containing protein [Phycisphaeraceae bacterium]